jgi:hypothetical protein
MVQAALEECMFPTKQQIVLQLELSLVVSRLVFNQTNVTLGVLLLCFPMLVILVPSTVLVFQVTVETPGIHSPTPMEMELDGIVPVLKALNTENP